MSTQAKEKMRSSEQEMTNLDQEPEVNLMSDNEVDPDAQVENLDEESTKAMNDLSTNHRNAEVQMSRPKNKYSARQMYIRANNNVVLKNKFSMLSMEDAQEIDLAEFNREHDEEQQAT